MKISSIAAVMGIEFDGTHAMRKETRQSLQNQAVKSLEAQADRPYEPFNIGFEKSDLVQLHMAKTFPSDFEQTPKLRHDMLVAYSKYREILSAPEIDQPQPIAADRVGAAWTGHVSIHRRAEDLGRSTGVLDVPESALIGRKILLGRLWDEAGQPLENEDNLQTVLENLQSKQRSMKEERQQRLEYLEMAIAETGPGGSIQALMDVLSDARATRELGIEVARILRADSDITPDKLKDRVEAGSIVHNLLAAAPQEKKQWVASSIINGFLGATGSFFGGRLDDKKSALFGARWARKIISPDNTPHGAISVNGVVQKARSEIKSIQHALDDDVGIPCQEDRFLAAIKTIFPEAVVDERITRNVRFFLHEIDALRREQETIKVDESPLQESAEQPQAVASRTSWFGGLLRSKREREGSNLPPRPPSLDC